MPFMTADRETSTRGNRGTTVTRCSRALSYGPREAEIGRDRTARAPITQQEPGERSGPTHRSDVSASESLKGTMSLAPHGSVRLSHSP